MPIYKVKNLFKDILQTIYNCCIDQSTFLISKLSHWYLSWRSSPQFIKYLQIFTRNMPSVSLDTQFYTISLEKFEESVNRRRIDNTIKEQTMIYKTLHRKLKIEQHELFKIVGLRCSRQISSSYCIAACEILRFPSEI